MGYHDLFLGLFLDGEDVTEVVEVGSVVRAIPGPVVTGDPEFIALLTEEGQWRWNAPPAHYDPDTVDDAPQPKSTCVPVSPAGLWTLPR